MELKDILKTIEDNEGQLEEGKAALLFAYEDEGKMKLIALAEDRRRLNLILNSVLDDDKDS